MVSHCSTSRSTSLPSSSALAPAAAVRTIRPCPSGRTASTIRRSRFRSLSSSRFEMPYARAVRDEHDEPPGERDLLGQAGALGPDGVLGHLAEDGLTRAGAAARSAAGPTTRLDVVGVVADVPVVEDGVLRRADVDERRLHAGQHVLHPAAVDVPVDLGGVVRGPGDVVLDQGPPLQQGDLGHLGAHVDADHVAADRLAPPLASAPAAGGRRPLGSGRAVAVRGGASPGPLARSSTPCPSPRCPNATALGCRHPTSRGCAGWPCPAERAPLPPPGVASSGTGIGRTAGPAGCRRSSGARPVGRDGGAARSVRAGTAGTGGSDRRRTVARPRTVPRRRHRRHPAGPLPAAAEPRPCDRRLTVDGPARPRRSAPILRQVPRPVSGGAQPVRSRAFPG